MASQLKWTCGCLLPLIVAAVTATSIYAMFLVQAPTIWNGVRLLLSAAFLLWFSREFLHGLKDRRRASVFPYFERNVGDIDTFRKGRTLAERFAEVDSLAVTLSVTPLHTFGFNDDLDGETLEWHDAALGLASVTPLLKHLRQHPNLISDQEGVIEDLERIERALEKAREKRIRFSLLINVGDGYTSQEHLVRKGSVL